jgi:DNA-binding MarR family transcriptional regulator
MERQRLSTTIGYLLAHVCKAHHFRVRTLLHEIGLYRGQQFVLRALWHEEGVTHSELAERLNVHPATVSNALKRMERAGFLERRPDLEDQRVSRVYLTGAGREIRGAVERVWAELEEETFHGFSEEERETLERLLQKVYENLEGEHIRSSERCVTRSDCHGG